MARTKKIIEEVVESKIDSYSIEKLPGIGPIKAKRFQDAGVFTLIDVLIRGSQEITQITGMKKEEAEALVEKVRLQLIADGKIPNTSDVMIFDNYRKTAKLFKTGSEALDLLFGGGITTQAMTMVYGAEGAGKTQLLLTLIVKTLEENLGKKPEDQIDILMIDNEGTFDLDRLMEIATVRGIVNEDNKKEFLRGLHYELALDTDSIKRVVDNCASKVIEQNIKLILVDGMIGKFRLEFDQGRGELNVRQNTIKPILKHLNNMAEYLNLAVLITNQVMGNPDGGYGGEPDKPIGGHIAGHNCRFIVRFNKGGGKKRIAKFIKSNKHAISEEVFFLNQEGVSDIENLKVGHCKKHDIDWTVVCRLCEPRLVNVKDRLYGEEPELGRPSDSDDNGIHDEQPEPVINERGLKDDSLLLT